MAAAGVDAEVELRGDPGVVGRVGPGRCLRDLYSDLRREAGEVLVGPDIRRRVPLDGAKVVYIWIPGPGIRRHERRVQGLRRGVG